MTTDDLPVFSEGLIELAELFDAKLTESKMVIYFQALCHLPLDVVCLALQAAIHKFRFMPKPAELLSLAVGDSEDGVEAAWQYLRQAMSRVGAYASVFVEDGALAEAALAVFGSWPEACAATLSHEMWSSKRKEFGRVYAMMLRRGNGGTGYLVGLTEQQNGFRIENIKFSPVFRIGRDGRIDQLLATEAATVRRLHVPRSLTAVAEMSSISGSGLAALAEGGA